MPAGKFKFIYNSLAVFRRKLDHKGLTFTEIIVTVAILSVIAIPIAYYLTSVLKGVTDSQKKIEAQEELRVMLSKIEPYIMEANEILEANASSMTFICDLTRASIYNMYGDTDGDGIPNIQDPDDDNDAHLSLTFPPTAQWRVGYDLKDDDDDNDGFLDMRVKIYLDANRLIMAVSENEGPWKSVVWLEGITSFNLSYFGSKREDLGKNIDLDNDGVITSYEIDWTLPPTGHGNRSGRIDTKDELKYIVSVYLDVGIDKNRDGVEDYSMETELAPHLLVLKRRQ